jgi:hypothetical protein
MRSRARAGRLALAVAFAGVLAVPAVANAQNAQPETSDVVPTLVPRDHTPLYHLVSQFFPMMLHFKQNHPLLYEDRLLELGIEPRSEASVAFGRALEAAEPILARPSVDPSLVDDEGQFLAFEEAALRAKARDLAKVYGDLLAGLEESGVNPDHLRSYVDQTMREDVSVWIDTAPGADPVDRLLADRNVQAVLRFDEMAEAAYRSHVTNSHKKGV